jgi:hypothetical protein
MSAETSADLFSPRMPGVDQPDDLDKIFHEAREIARGKGSEGEHCCVAIVTPGRMIAPTPALPPDAITQADLENVRTLFGTSESLNIVAIAYNDLAAMMADEGKGKVRSIPFLGQLAVFAAAGHSVTVFEGHPSALQMGLHDCDALLVDSGMLPFLQEDWLKVAKLAMKPEARYFVFDRGEERFCAIAPVSSGRGWIYREPDGEASYTNCLLTALGKQPGKSVQLRAGEALPSIAGFVIESDAEWANTLPFRYEELDSKRVIRLLLWAAGHRMPFFFGIRRKIVLNTRLAGDGGTSYCPFELVVSGFGTPKSLTVTRQAI